MTQSAVILKNPQAAVSAANAIAADLNALERHVDEALMRAHAIGQTLSSGRMAAGISATFGQAMFDDLAKVIPDATSLRGSVVAMHLRMQRRADSLGVSPTLGIEEKPPENGPETPWPKAELQPVPVLAAAE